MEGTDMKFRFILLPALLGLSLVSLAHALPGPGAQGATKPAKVHRIKANETKHSIVLSARPAKALGHSVKSLALVTGQAVVTAGTFSFSAFDTMVVDPLGIALQAFADGVDMFIAAPLESLPEPFEAAGDGVHVVYAGIDKVGQQLAK